MNTHPESIWMTRRSWLAVITLIFAAHRAG
jgi:hypothetical protein